jgi:tetratricopeptide (TPR) repeat protein
MNWDQALRRSVQLAIVLTFITQPVSAQLIGGRSEATNCSNAIVGNVRDSTINVVCGTPPEQLAALVRQAGDLSETQKKLIANLESQLDLNQRQIRAALEILGENNIPPERLASKLVEIAERFKELQLNVASHPGDDLKITALKADAQRAIDAGDLAKADGLLADIETEQRGALERLAVNAADTLSQRGDIALTRLRYLDAAKHFAAAAALLVSNDDKRLSYLTREADARFKQGDEFGDNGSLNAAIERLTRLVALTPRERVPLDWATTQTNLGIALEVLGERESGTARLEEAVAAFRDALMERTRERVPLEWALTQNILGTALQTLGERESGTARLEEAVAAYREALKEQTRERVPLNWAATQNNLGNALEALGERESGTARLEEAVAAFRDALMERTRERVPLDWAMTQNNLGIALGRLGAHEEAVAAYRDALMEYTRERVPLDWAMTQNNLGIALGRLGAHEEAVAAYRDALQEFTRERVPLQWAMTQNNLGFALQRLGERESGTARLEEAVAAFRDALMERTRARVPLDWAVSFGSQGVALMLLAQRVKDAPMAQTAVLQIEAAFKTLRDGGHVPFAAYYERQLPEARRIRDALTGLSGQRVNQGRTRPPNTKAR